MEKFNKERLLFLITALLLVASPSLAKKKKPPHPFDLYNHEMHTGIFESLSVACETCHADPDSYGDRSKVNKTGCHLCHNSPKPIIEATKDCSLCHKEGPPKPQSHRVDWTRQHQVPAKQNPEECKTCHTNATFCINCHKRRDTVSEKVHRRNFRLFHSIEARANPRRCDACHSVTFCQECHAGRGSSKR
ncbi:MAG: hypothetical protein HYW02_05970 [Deltaproteobacteria bacterium]|nr:hypothetical protein [Deltaproteobacteria bacterium]